MHVTLLGEQLLAGADGTVQARSSRTLALIAFLVAHGDAPQTRQRIAAAFWPDSTDEQALTNLRRELHHLRGVLGDEPALVVTPRDLAWRDSPTCVVDVRAFHSDRAAALAAAAGGDRDAFLTRAAAAVDRYGGEFLPGNDDDWALGRPAPSWSSSASTCSTGASRRTGRPATRPGRRRRPPPPAAAAAGGGRLPHADGAAGRPWATARAR